MNTAHFALVAAILSLVGVEADFTNETRMTLPKLAATETSQGESSIKKNDGCAKWRNLKNSLRSNEELWIHAMTVLNDTYATCALFVVCKLHENEDNVCEPAMEYASNRCFPRTKAGQSVTVNCPETFMGEPFNGTIEKACQDNGTWAEKAIASCLPISPKPSCFYTVVISSNVTEAEVWIEQKDCDNHLRQLRLIALVGDILSLVTTIAAFIVFWWLNNIRCRRNIIHWNLITTYIFRITMSFLVGHPYILTTEGRLKNWVLCRMLMTLYMYGEHSNYFWMFVEGLHLHMMVVSGYSHDRISMKVYAGIGWGGPLIPTVLWMIVRVLDGTECWYLYRNEKYVKYIYQAPILLLLILNFGILVVVVSIIFTKLQSGYNISGVTVRNEKDKYIKATKAALFLFPLLGFTYVAAFLTSPTTKSAILIFMYFHAISQSLQGCLVSLIYCFGNNEVQKAWKDKVRHIRLQSRLSCCWPIDKVGIRGRTSRSISTASTNITNLPPSRAPDSRGWQQSDISAQPEFTETFHMPEEETFADCSSAKESWHCAQNVKDSATSSVL